MNRTFVSLVVALLALGAMVAVDVKLDMKLEEMSSAALRLFQDFPQD